MKTRNTHASLFLSLLLVATCFFSLSPNIAFAASIIVDTTVYGNVSDGDCSLFEAIEAANSNAGVDSCIAGEDAPVIDIIQVPSGIYPVSGIAGDFDGDTGLPDITSAMVITGEDSIIARDIITPVRILHVNTGGGLTLEGLVISNGSAENGGNIYNRGALTVTASSILSGTAVEDGGGVYNIAATATISDSKVLTNVSSQDGGGIYNTNASTVTVVTSEVSKNNAASGGGIANFASILKISDSDLVSNTAIVSGGAIRMGDISAVATILDGTIEKNSAEDGGGIYSFNSAVLISGTQVASNSATGNGGGIVIVDSAILDVVNATFSNNKALSRGGAIDNFAGILTIDNSVLTRNSAESGGAISNESSGVFTITTSTIATNTATENGGGLYSSESEFHFAQSAINGNIAGENGGAIYNDGSIAPTLDGVSVISNSVTGDGGGIWNLSSPLTVMNSTFAENAASNKGGGLYITDSSVSLITTTLFANSAENGGGVFSNASELNVEASRLEGNRSGNNGGAIRQEVNSTLVLTKSEVISNSAVNNGGGISSQSSDPEITSSDLLSNTAGNDGGALHNADALVVIIDTLLIANRASGDGGAISNVAPSIVNLVGGELRANQAENGGVLSNNGIVDISQTRLLTNTASSNGGAIHQTANGATNVSQSCIIGNSDNAVHHVGGPAIVASNNWWGVPSGPSGAGPGTGDSVSVNVSFNPFQSFAILDCPGDPAVAWSAAAYSTSETSGNFTATVFLSPTVSDTSVTVIATITGQPEQTVTFPPNSGSQPVVIHVVNDSVYTGKVIQLGLQAPNGAILGNPIAATLTITDDESPSVALAVTKVANVTSARVGDLITYTYRITNTGQSVLTTITATDDKLGEITGLAGALAINGTRTATAGYIVKMADLANSPLENTITVVGSTGLGATTQAEASASVPIRRHKTTAPVILKGEAVDK